MLETFKENKALVIKKGIALSLVIFGMVFIMMNREVYYSEYKDKIARSELEVQTADIIEFKGDKEFKQEFYGWDGELRRIQIRFSNQGNHSASGTVTLNVLDEQGNVIQTTSKDISSVKTTKFTKFDFSEPKELEEGKLYVLQVVIDDAENPQGFGILTFINRGNLFGQLSEDGKNIDNCLGAVFLYKYYNIGAIIHMYMFLFLALIFIFIPFSKVDQLVKQKWDKDVDSNKIVSRIFFFATPILCYMMADRFNGYSIVEIFHRMFRWTFVFNMLIYILLWFVIYTIVNRTQYTGIILLSIVFMACIANYYVWIFRGCPILAADLQSAKTAMNVAANFSYSLDFTGVWGVVYIITFISMLLSLKGYKGAGPKRRLVMALCSVLSVFIFNVIFFHSNVVKNCGIIASVWHPQSNYDKNGTALSFVLSWSYIKVERPSGYSAEKVADLIEGYESDNVASNASTGKETPNIIAIMNESLADLSYNGEIELSEDYLPFIHSLEEDTIKGKLYVSIEGANTANSEFEFLTGNSMAFLPFRCIPYNLYINDITPSMAQNMKAQGYINVNAYHPYLRSGWNRENVYPLLGFNNFYDQDYYYENGNDKLVRNYISDESDFEQITEDFEKAHSQSDEPFYLFNVTMQNHGGYDGKRGYVDTDIKIENDSLYYEEAEQYINLAKKSDTAFKQLVEYFEDVDDPTIIVMFGDHQPPVTNDFYSAQFGKDVNNLSPEKQANWYATPYIIWANYDIEEAEVDMSANYLSSYVQNVAGTKLTGYNKYLLELQKTLPAISAVCYMDAEGNVYGNDEKSEYSDLIKEYQMIQYNQLFDEEGRFDDFFFLKQE